MSSAACKMHPSAADLDENEDIQRLEKQSFDSEKIARQ
jgi:hypothetical protein